MKIEKLVINYHESTKQVILEWQKEVDKVTSIGNDYFPKLTEKIFDQFPLIPKLLTDEEINPRLLTDQQIHEKAVQAAKVLAKFNTKLNQGEYIEKLKKEYYQESPSREQVTKRREQVREQAIKQREEAIKQYVEDAKKIFSLKNQRIDELKSFLLNNWELSKTQPVHIDPTNHLWHISGDFKYQNLWLYQDAIYGIDGTYIDDEQKLLILEYSDRERRKFEQLKNKFSGKDSSSDEVKYERTRIPEQVRIAVWRRDQGRCARCGSRENLEYDHIVPVSKGGTNTERNVELLCQNHNRSKGNRIE